MSGCLCGRIHELFGSGGICDRGQAKCIKETEAYLLETGCKAGAMEMV